MEFKRYRLLTGLAMMLALTCVVSAQAATLSLSLQYAGSFVDYDFNPATYALVDGNVVDVNDMVTVLPVSVIAPTDFHQFDIYYTMDPSAPPTPTGGSPPSQTPENSLQQLILDVVMGSGLTQDPGLPYTPAPLQMYDPPAPGAGGGANRALYTENSDATGNLQRIIGTTDALAAFGLDPGETAASMLGSFYLNYIPGLTPSAVSLTPAASAPVDPWLLHTNGWIDTTSPYTHSAGVGYVPETGTMTGSVNDGSGNTWDLTGAFDLPPGVPEPASITLIGLAMVGLLGLRRRG